MGTLNVQSQVCPNTSNNFGDVSIERKKKLNKVEVHHLIDQRSFDNQVKTAKHSDSQFFFYSYTHDTFHHF